MTEQNIVSTAVTDETQVELDGVVHVLGMTRAAFTRDALLAKLSNVQKSKTYQQRKREYIKALP